MVAQDGLSGLINLLNPARTCAALGEARVIKIMPAVVLHVCNRVAQPAEYGDITWVMTRNVYAKQGEAANLSHVSLHRAAGCERSCTMSTPATFTCLRHPL